MQLLDFYSAMVELKKSFNVADYMSLVLAVESSHTELIHDALTARVSLLSYREDLALIYPAYKSDDFALNADLVALCKTVAIVVDGSTLPPSIYHACLDVLKWHRENSAYTALRDMLIELGFSLEADSATTKLLLGILTGGPIELPQMDSSVLLTSLSEACDEHSH